jgi:hypothetical protein
MGIGGGGGGKSPIMFVLLGILGLGAVVFALLTVTFYQKANTATTTLNNQVNHAVSQAKTDQKKADDEAAIKANESPFRSYIAPVSDGSFQINFPKNWSGWVDQEPSGTQVSLAVNPDFVRKSNNADELMATRVQLIERPSAQYMQQFAGNIQRGTIKQANTTISGQPAYDLTGQFSDQKTSRMVVVPVRDKVLIFINENNKYAQEFTTILAQAKIIP